MRLAIRASCTWEVRRTNSAYSVSKAGTTGPARYSPVAPTTAWCSSSVGASAVCVVCSRRKISYSRGRAFSARRRRAQLLLASVDGYLDVDAERLAQIGGDR